MGTLWLPGFCRRSGLLSNIFQTAKSNNMIKYCNVLSDLGEVQEYELGNFEPDIKPYLRHRRRRKIEQWFRDDVPKHEDVIIKCRNMKLNYYRNQTYNKFQPIPLASENWRSHKSNGDYFSIHIFSNDYKKLDETPLITFEESGLSPETKEILKSKNIEKMSEIQIKALPIILKGSNTLITAETGCGKTLAYLLPIIQQVLKWKAELSHTEYNSPFVIILTPSRELTDQICDIGKWFKSLDICVRRLLSGRVNKKIHNPIVEKIDILVSTIGVLTKMSNTDLYSWNHVRHIVLDEADCLLDDSFNEAIVGFLKQLPIRSKPTPLKDEGVQLTLVCATMPTSLPDILAEVVDVELIEKITTDNIHRAMPHVQQKFWKMARSSKPAYLLQIAKKEYKKKCPLIIFCNKVETCDWASSFLNESGVSNIHLSKNVSIHKRIGLYEKFKNGEETILVCTSIASRGLDTYQVEHVLNYDFPLFIVDYIHRCGRTGRLSSKTSGKVTNFISGRNEIALVQKVEKAVRTTSEFENVNPNIKRIIRFKDAKPYERILGVGTDEKVDE